MSYTVGEVAKLAGITVRTLHHYDEIGLLQPSDRTDAGYRLYLDEDLVRLQQILFYRELGFSLDEISTILTDPTWDVTESLESQHALLTERIERLGRMVKAVEKELEARHMGINLTPEERFEVFGDFDPDQYADEAKDRWGDTDAYKQSARRASQYTKDDWKRIQEQGDVISKRLASLFQDGAAPDSVEAMDAAEAHRQYIGASFYDCPPQMHAGLGEMYVADERFAAYWNAYAEGMTSWVRDAFSANAGRQTA